jgi:hypothetical protein
VYQCSHSAQVSPDGSLPGVAARELNPKYSNLGFIEEKDIEGPGDWTCVARGQRTDPFDNQDHFTPWTAPITTFVREYFAPGKIRLVDRRGPRYGVAMRLPDAFANGGRFIARVRRSVNGHRRGRARVVRGRVKNRQLRVNFSIPHRGCWDAAVAFAGTHEVAPGETGFNVSAEGGRLYVPAAGC